MRAIGIAALVSGLIATPVSAVADETIVASLSVTVAPTAVPSYLLPLASFSFPFPLFNPVIGKLDNVSIALSGVISASITQGKNPAVDFFLIYQGTSFDFIQSDFSDSTMNTVSLSGSILSGSFGPSSSALRGFTGTGSNTLDFAFDIGSTDNSVTIQSVGPLTGSITYDYTPNSLTLTPSVPEPSTWAMMLVGFAGLALVGRSARGGFVNWARSGRTC